MRKYIWILILACGYISAEAQTISIRDLGAKGDGRTDDTKAFEALNEWIAQKKSGKIIIPAGTYMVGEQKRNSQNNRPGSWETPIIINISNAHNLTITGTPNSVIKYNPNQRYGAFDPVTGKKHNSVMPFYDGRYVAAMSYCIYINKSSNINISNLILDGNSSKMNIGGPWGDTGYQLAHYGVFINSSNKIAVDNIIAKYFCLDGLALNNEYKSVDSRADHQISINNFTSLYNGRQGFSWVGGTGLIVRNSTFSHTGKGVIASAPGAGLSIEPEGGNLCRNGRFVNCRFEDNGNAFVTDLGSLTHNIEFTKCTFGADKQFAIVGNGSKLSFIDCTISGCIMPGNGGGACEGNIFERCIFNDVATSLGNIPSLYLIDGGGGGVRYRIRNSTFNLSKKRFAWIESSATVAADIPVIENCTVNLNYPDSRLTVNEFFGYLRNIVLNNNIFASPSSKVTNYFYCLNTENVRHQGNRIVAKTPVIRWALSSDAKSVKSEF